MVPLTRTVSGRRPPAFPLTLFHRQGLINSLRSEMREADPPTWPECLTDMHDCLVPGTLGLTPASFTAPGCPCPVVLYYRHSLLSIPWENSKKLDKNPFFRFFPREPEGRLVYPARRHQAVCTPPGSSRRHARDPGWGRGAYRRTRPGPAHKPQIKRYTSTTQASRKGRKE